MPRDDAAARLHDVVFAVAVAVAVVFAVAVAVAAVFAVAVAVAVATAVGFAVKSKCPQPVCRGAQR